MQKIFVLLFVILITSCTNAQKPAPTPTPESSPTELKLEHMATITAISYSLKTLPAVENAFQAKEDGFTVRLPPPSNPYQPAVFPQPGDMPKSGKVSWKMQEATVEIRIMPFPPGLIATWTKEQIVGELTNILDSSFQNVTGGEKVYEKDLKQGDLIGREAKIRARGHTMVVRVFIANDRSYMLAADLGRDADSESLVKKAFDTFQLKQD